MNQEKRTKVLRVILIVVGAVLALTGLLALLPTAWLEGAARVFVVQCFGIADAEVFESLWPTSQLSIYALRLSFIAYMWIGITVLLAASDPKKYRNLVDVAIAGLLLMSATCLVAGIVGGIPVLWCLGDAVSAFVPAVLLLIFRFRRAEG